MASEQKRELFIWKTVHEKKLIQEVLSVEPYQHKIGTKERGSAWTEVADRLIENGLRVTQRSVREKFDRLMKDFNKKENEEKRASGVDVEYGEVERGLLDIKERMVEIEEQRETEDKKQKKEKATAEEMRRQATERLSETKKRRASSPTEDDDEAGTADGRKRTPRNNPTMVEAVRESIELKKRQQEKNEELRKKELDARAAEMQQQREFQQNLLVQQQQLQRQQAAFSMQMMGALSELIKLKK